MCVRERERRVRVNRVKVYTCIMKHEITGQNSNSFIIHVHVHIIHTFIQPSCHKSSCKI